MATRTSADLQVMLFGGYDLHAYMNNVSPLSDMGIVEDITTFGASAQVQGYAGKRGITIPIKGYFDDSALGSNAALMGELSATAPFCLGMSGNTVGAPFLGLTAVERSYNRMIAVGKFTAVDAAFVSTGETDNGLIQQPLGAVTANGNGTAIDGTASSSFGLVAYLQVPAFTLGSATNFAVTMQDSADNVTFANIASGAFTVVTAAPFAQRLVIPGTIRRYTRAIWSWTGGAGGSSATFFVGIFRGATANVYAPAPHLGEESSDTTTAGDAAGVPPPSRRRASPAVAAADGESTDTEKE